MGSQRKAPEHTSYFATFPDGSPNERAFLRIDVYKGKQFGRGDDYNRAHQFMHHKHGVEPFKLHATRDEAEIAKRGLQLRGHYREMIDGEFSVLW